MSAHAFRVHVRRCKEHEAFTEGECLEAYCDFPAVIACSTNRDDVINHIKGSVLHALGDWKVVPDSIRFLVQPKELENARSAEDLAAALERDAKMYTSWFGAATDVTHLTGAEHVLREMAAVLPTLEHTSDCESRGAGDDNGLPCTCERGKVTCKGCRPCTCGLDRLLRLVTR